MLSAYPACFFKEDNGYSVVFPDLGYLATCGETLEEALTMAVDCLAGYLWNSQRTGETVAAPSALADVHPADVAAELGVEPGECFVNMVMVDVTEYAKKHFEKAVKKTLTIPAWLNDLALAGNINFSQVLQDALKTQLHVN